MFKNGMYAKYKNVEYEITVDSDGNVKLLTTDKGKIDKTFVDRYSSEVYTKVVTKDELTNCVSITPFIVVKGEEIQVLQERNGKFQIGTGDSIIGNKLNMPRIDRDTWMDWIAKEEVELIEKKSPFDPNDL